MTIKELENLIQSKYKDFSVRDNMFFLSGSCTEGRFYACEIPGVISCNVSKFPGNCSTNIIHNFRFSAKDSYDILELFLELIVQLTLKVIEDEIVSTKHTPDECSRFMMSHIDYKFIDKMSNNKKWEHIDTIYNVNSGNEVYLFSRNINAEIEELMGEGYII